MASERIRQLMSEAERALQAGDTQRALSCAQAALRSIMLLGATPGPQEFAVRHLVATCHERAGDHASALRAHRENAQRGSPLEATYQRLALLGERHGDVEAVRTGTLWLRDFAARFGLVDVKAEQRLHRAERREARKRTGEAAPAVSADDGAPSDRVGCAGVIVGVLGWVCAWLAS